MVAPDLQDSAERAVRRDPELVAVALHDEHRDPHGFELCQAARRRLAPCTARRLEREGQAEDADRADRFCGAAGDAGAKRPAADDERQPLQLALPQPIDDGRPGRVELPRRSG